MKNFSIDEIESIKDLDYCSDYQVKGLCSYVNAKYVDVYNHVWYIMKISGVNHDTAQIKKCLKRAEQLEVVKCRISDAQSVIIKYSGMNRCMNWIAQFKVLLQILETINNL